MSASKGEYELGETVLRAERGWVWLKDKAN
jgi:hypothetical protein